MCSRPQWSTQLHSKLIIDELSCNVGFNNITVNELLAEVQSANADMDPRNDYDEYRINPTSKSSPFIVRIRYMGLKKKYRFRSKD